MRKGHKEKKYEVSPLKAFLSAAAVPASGCLFFLLLLYYNKRKSFSNLSKGFLFLMVLWRASRKEKLFLKKYFAGFSFSTKIVIFGGVSISQHHSFPQPLHFPMIIRINESIIQPEGAYSTFRIAKVCYVFFFLTKNKVNKVMERNSPSTAFW